MHRHFLRATLLLCLPAIPLLAQLPSNATLNGIYNVHYLGVNSASSTGSDAPVNFSGTITFNGSGGFTVTGQGSSTFLSTGSYTVLSNGMLQLTNPFDPVSNDGTVLYGGVGSNGVIWASSTESIYVDMFIGIPQASGASNSTLSGTYNVASMTLAGLASGGFTNTNDAFFPVTAANGSLGNVTMQGYTLQTGSAQQTQNSAAATYSINSNGTGTMTFPAPTGVSSANALLSGAQVLAVSQDGSFFIAGSAGSAASYNFILGLKAGTSKTLNNGYYFTGYFQNYDPGNTSDESTGIYGSWGSANEINSIQTELDHERTNCDACYTAYDEIFDDGTFSFSSNGLYSYTGSPYAASAFAVGPNATMVIGAGLQNVNFELLFYVQAPTMTAPAGTSVFLNPQGVINAASSAPFSSQYSPGEVITLYGTNLASGNNTAAAPFPNNLSGVQVLVTGAGSAALNAPVYNVCSSCNPTQVSAVIPYTVTSTTGLISFQVNNNGTPSNTVSGYLGNSSPGIFTIPPGGIYDGAIEHGTTGAVVNTGNPAVAGETVAIYLTGLGPVNQTVAAGSAAPTSPLATVPNPVYVTFYDSAGNSFQGSIAYQGLAPTLGGLYQINVVIPSGMAAGEAFIDITTSVVVDAYGDLAADVDSVEATIAIQ
jgi:uncharacterized protein (TIGR03437 family)